MKKVFKYVIDDTEKTLMLPVGAEVLSVGVQENTIVLWALVDPAVDLKNRTFIVRVTGWDIQHSNIKFIGTCQMPNGLVFHVFEYFN